MEQHVYNIYTHKHPIKTNGERNKITESPFIFCETKLFTRTPRQQKNIGMQNQKQKIAASFRFL